MSRYGAIHRLTDVVERTIPKRGSGKYDALFVHRLIQFLKCLDAAQESNVWVTLAMHTGGAMWFYYKGQDLFSFHPAQKYLRLEIGTKYLSAQKRELLKTIRNAQLKRKLFCKVGTLYKQWRSQTPELEIVERFIKKLPRDTPKLALDAPTHPRNFPGEIRELALENFIQNGRKCRGVPALGRKAHKVTKERIEFDHILPDVKGGSRSELNIQVLCEECNRLKRAHAL